MLSEDSVVAGRRLGDSLAAAVAAGLLVPRGDEGYDLIPPPPRLDWFIEHRERVPGCKFLMHLMYTHVYRRMRVPYGCHDCYKVKVVAQCFRELIALKAVAQSLPYTYKVGTEHESPYSMCVYSAFFYFRGLEAAQLGWRAIRDALDPDECLGSTVRATIKRGCTEFEMTCGPSDAYQFDSEQKMLEDWLAARIRVTAPPSMAAPLRLLASFRHWITVAHRLGDESYLEWTDGRPLYPPTVEYPSAPK